MAYSTVDVVGGSSASAGTSATITVGDAEAGDDVFLHVAWANPGVSSITDNDWVPVAGTNITGPGYRSALYHHVLDGDDSLNLSWTGSSHYTWQVLACGGLDTSPVDEIGVAQTTSAANVPRLVGMTNGDHVLCFAAAINAINKTNVRAYPDVGWVTAEGTESAASRPTLWVGQFGGPVGDLDTTFPACVYFDPPPTHAIGYALSVALA